jgi:hypothetical protein
MFPKREALERRMEKLLTKARFDMPLRSGPEHRAMFDGVDKKTMLGMMIEIRRWDTRPDLDVRRYMHAA